MRAALLTISIAIVMSSAGWSQTRQDELLEDKRQKAETLTEQTVSKAEERIRKLEKSRFPTNIFVKGFRGVRPLIGGMPSGSGAVAGIGYVRGLDYELMKVEANARYSTRGFSELDAALELPTAGYGGPLRLRLDARYHDYTSLRFYGLGNDSAGGDRAYYREIESRFGGTLAAELSSRVELFATGAWQRIDAGEADRAPSIGDRASLADVPGLAGERTEFAVYGGGVHLDLLDRQTPAAGAGVLLDATRYDDQDANRHGFTRYIAAVRGYVPLGYRNRYIALRFRTSHSLADNGQHLPFYLMETLGGARTIRGFNEYRFRDSRNLLLSAEYRWEVWTHLDFVAFVDTGKVFSDWNQLNLSGLHTGYGFGARFHAPGGFVLRFDVAQSSEGTKLHIGAGPSF